MGQWCEPMSGVRLYIYKYTAQPRYRFQCSIIPYVNNLAPKKTPHFLRKMSIALFESHVQYVGMFLGQNSSNSNTFCTQYNESICPLAPDLFLLKRKH